MSWTNRDPIEPGRPGNPEDALRNLRSRGARCPRPDLLQAAQADVLPPDQAREINEHLEECPLCNSLLADLDALDDVELDRAGQKRIWNQVKAGMPERTRRASVSWWIRPLPMAAATASLVLLSLSLIFIHDHQERKGLTANNPSPPATAEVASVFSLERAPVVLPPAQPALVWRGQQDTSAKQIKDLQQALVPYDSGDYAGAARLLEVLRKKYPRMAQAPFYLGVCQLFLGQNDAAIRSLQDAQDLAGPSLADQTTWYLALAKVKTGKIDKAKSLLTKQCSAEGKDSARACAGIKELEGQH